jgi:hypothetical protein
MSTSIVEPVRALDLAFTEDELMVSLADGRRIIVPLAWFPRLLHANAEARNDFRWIGDGVGIHWPQLDEDLSVAGFLRGTMAPWDLGHSDHGPNPKSL